MDEPSLLSMLKIFSNNRMLSRLVMLLAGLFLLLLITQKVKEGFEDTCSPCPEACSPSLFGKENKPNCAVQTQFCYKNNAGNWCTHPDYVKQWLQPIVNGVITSA